ncbi:hypothetical protein [Bdellovibrio sp. HCB2-146]|uniref:hypothetical protein n=1 Tax=Bdellovibrio sp. HCB2-146 TaxID=3394362 RepID=UPI0039BC6730
MKQLFTVFVLVFLFLKTHADTHNRLDINAPTIVWAFSSLGDKVPTVQNSLVTNRHELFRMYYRELSDHHHSMISATMPRIEKELKNKRLVCFPGSSEAERRKEFSYLTPQYVQPSPRLIVKKEMADLLTDNGKKSINLKEILLNKNLRGIIGEGRSYGPTIDKILASTPHHLRVVLAEMFSPNTFNMIETKRADYTIEYAFIAKSFKEGQPRFSDLVSIPFSDVEPAMVQYLACSKTPEGLEVVRRADKIIRDHVKNSSYWTGVFESIPANEKEKFQKEINKFISERIKHAVIIQ